MWPHRADTADRLNNLRPYILICLHIFVILNTSTPVTVAERPEACTVFPRSEAGILCPNPTQGMDVWYV
jgi:hypothetical protein